MKRFATLLAVAAIAVPTASAAVDPLDPVTCHHHGMSCPSHTQPPTRIVTVAKADGFDWADAGIGAASALGAVFVAVGLGAAIRRPQRVTA